MGFHRSVSQSPKRSSIPTDLDENEENYNPLMRGNTTPRHKKSATKNYMSSTFSAASKAVTPKKKILAERNSSEASSEDLESDKNSVLGDPMRSPKPTTMESLKPYDPVFNYTSPRPRFLRYKPKWRREIRPGSETDDGLTSGSVSSDDSNSSSLSLVEREIRSLNQSDEEEFKVSLEEPKEKPKEKVELKESFNEEETKEVEKEEVKEISEKIIVEEEETEETEEEEEEEEEEEDEGLEEYESPGVLKKAMLLLLALGFSAMFIVLVNRSASFSHQLSVGEGIEVGQCRAWNYSVKDVLEMRSFETGDGFLRESTIVAFEENDIEIEIEKDSAVETWVFEDLKSFEESKYFAVEDREHNYDGLKSFEDSESGESVSVEVVVLVQEEPKIVYVEEDVKESNFQEEELDVAEKADDEPVKEQKIVDTEEELNQADKESIFQEEEDEEAGEEEEEGIEAHRSSSSSYFASTLSDDQNLEQTIDNTGNATTQVTLVRNLITNKLRQIEAEFAVKVFIGFVSFSAMVAYCLSLASSSNENTAKTASKEEKEKKKSQQTFDQVYSYSDDISSLEFSQSHAPSVEFLGEFVIGEEKEVSSENKTFSRKAQTGSDFSTPLHGSYISREDYGDGEANTSSRRSSRKSAVMTPVRRSTRIRNLSIKSP